MPITQHTDSNGLTYNAIGTAEWSGAEGDRLRAVGWKYCGFGTWGIYISQGSNPCGMRLGAPNILPPAPQEPTSSGGGGVPLVTDKACGGCRKSTTTTQPSIGNVGVPQQPGTKVIVKKGGLPWWVILLALLLATKVVGDE